MKGLKIKETSATACILNSQVNAHIFSALLGLLCCLVATERWFGTRARCVLCVFPSLAFQVCPGVQETLQRCCDTKGLSAVFLPHLF